MPLAPNGLIDTVVGDEKGSVIMGESPMLPRLASDDTTNRDNARTKLSDGLQRRMEQRHMQMMALTGTFGTGLFLASGKVIATGGPAGALISYTLVGTVSYAMLVSLAEMSAYAPIAGGLVTYVTRFLHPSAGFALGWMIFFHMGTGAAGEVVATSVLVSYWDERFASHQAAYITAFALCVAVVNFVGVRWFGEFEYIAGIFKILFMVGLMIAGLVLNLGGGPTHDRIGFRYWRDPGAFAPFLYPGAKGHFLGWFTTLPWSAYSYVGIEAIGFAVAEVKTPHTSIPRAIKRVFFRIAIFYVGGILIVGMLVPYTQAGLLKRTGTAAASPWVLALRNAGLKGWPSAVNACFLIYAFSACNTALYVGSRTMYALALRGHAPRVFAQTSKSGRPWPAQIAMALYLPLAYMAVYKGAATVFGWFLNLTSLTSFFTWGLIATTYMRFYGACKAQGLERASLPYKHWGQPWFAAWTIFWSVIIILFNGWYVFTKGNWDAPDFVSRYITVPILAFLIVVYGVWKRPGWTKAVNIDLWSNIPSAAEVGAREEVDHPRSWWRRVVSVLLG